MKNAFKLKAIYRIVGIIALATLIGFSMAACGDDSGPTGGGQTGGGGGSSTLTITGLPQGYWGLSVAPAGTDLSTSSAAHDALIDQKFEAGSNLQNNNVFIINYFYWQPTYGPYKGSGRKEVSLVNFDDGSWYYATVNFSNGSATVPWSSFTKTPD